MDEARIDRLTRIVAHRTGRRTLAAGAVGSLLASLLPGLTTTEAAKKRRRKKKPRCKQPKRRCAKQCVNVKSNRRHCGKCNRRCKPTEACRQGRCQPLPCGKGGFCWVFVTSTAAQGHLGGGASLATADQICNDLATNALLPGTYKAWLSTMDASPATRFSHNPGPYVLTNGVRIAHNWTDLTDGALLAPIDTMETGLPVPNEATQAVWTGTSTTGQWMGNGYDCNSWTSIIDSDFGGAGHVAEKDGQWTNVANLACDETLRLYCFQQS